MKKITYTMKTLSSVIVSPRAGQAFYADVDNLPPDLKAKDPVTAKEQSVKVVYPFYRYGEYAEYNPAQASYYLPGSSIKGALQWSRQRPTRLMADDVPIPNERIVLRNLWKAQYVQESSEAKFDVFFENVGVEMLRADTKLEGELYLEDSTDFLWVLEQANRELTAKMRQMQEYLRKLQKGEYKKEEFAKTLAEIEESLCQLMKEKNILIIGGYKGLLHSILLKEYTEKPGSGLYIDRETLLPHGLVEISAGSRQTGLEE